MHSQRRHQYKGRRLHHPLMVTLPRRTRGLHHWRGRSRAPRRQGPISLDPHTTLSEHTPAAPSPLTTPPIWPPRPGNLAILSPPPAPPDTLHLLTREIPPYSAGPGPSAPHPNTPPPTRATHAWGRTTANRPRPPSCPGGHSVKYRTARVGYCVHVCMPALICLKVQ